MAAEDQEQEAKEKIQTLEKELADLRQGLCLIQDYHHDLETTAHKLDAEETVDQSLLKPLLREDGEFEGIWRFHGEMLVPDPDSQVPAMQMYEAFVTYCSRKGRTAAGRPAFEFVLKKMGVTQRPEQSVWQGYRIRTDLS
jgi:predicted nuclease with TOPRIM domain